MAEWRNWAPGRFSLQVIDGGADFLREHGSEILESIHLDLGAMHYYVPGRGFVDVATESVITTEVAR
jgi:surfactin synthase thioesterase subunit